MTASRPPDRRFRAAIFDFDGLIADTESLHFETFSRVLREVGIVLAPDVDAAHFMGQHDRACFERVFEENGRSLQADELGELVSRKSRYYRTGLSAVRIFPGAAETVRDARERVAASVIASGGRRDEIESILEANDLLSFFPWMVTADDEVEPKPDPECFERALAGLRDRGLADLLPDECVVFEDSYRGVQAAAAAGMYCVAVTNSFDARRLRQAGANRVLGSLEEWDWEA